MRHLLYDLWFTLRNWRYFHAHGVLCAELRQWWNDYETPPRRYVDYSINMPVGVTITTDLPPVSSSELRR